MIHTRSGDAVYVSRKAEQVARLKRTARSMAGELTKTAKWKAATRERLAACEAAGDEDGAKHCRAALAYCERHEQHIKNLIAGTPGRRKG